MPQINPMIIGIYSGKRKPADIIEFLSPFVDEMEDVYKNGITVNGHKISVSVRCIICDSPARSFVKGVANFNAQNGCQKCTVEGEYSHISHCNYYPQIRSDLRTDRGFRDKVYGYHHKTDSPLLRLPLNMIDDFPVGDSLHLIDLGIMKRHLIGWRDGNMGNYRAKWTAKTTADISKRLKQMKMPAEIHRSVRGLDCLSHWKGTEYRTFFYYLSIVILKPVLPSDIYEHFLVLYCAVIICSSKNYQHLLDLAHELLLHYLDIFKKIYGEDYMTSNVHNLNHLVDDVKKFGVLSEFNAYPFESKLCQIKHMLRTGNNTQSKRRKNYEMQDPSIKKPNYSREQKS
ncbi:uncharacterized protein LOC110679553 [Aedes aegypti]|uniref:Transposase domain-containing protein n=1 Tax=Aedes aegypti TaxID=7159 RepID=A0A6I8TVH0_AEDAE|nr:uncharacterized protein LOC110679553 [Aedes aegypti]